MNEIELFNEAQEEFWQAANANNKESAGEALDLMRYIRRNSRYSTDTMDTEIRLAEIAYRNM